MWTFPDLNYIACDGDIYLLDKEGVITGKVVPCTMECVVDVSNIKGGEGRPIKVKIPCERYKEKEE